MDSLAKLVAEHKVNSGKPAPHEKAQSVNEILKVVPETKQYNFGYWLRKVGRAKYGDILAICKQAKGLDKKKYSVGGFLTNQLKILNGTTGTK